MLTLVGPEYTRDWLFSALRDSMDCDSGTEDAGSIVLNGQWVIFAVMHDYVKETSELLGEVSWEQCHVAGKPVNFIRSLYTVPGEGRKKLAEAMCRMLFDTYKTQQWMNRHHFYDFTDRIFPGHYPVDIAGKPVYYLVRDRHGWEDPVQRFFLDLGFTGAVEDVFPDHVLTGKAGDLMYMADRRDCVEVGRNWYA